MADANVCSDASDSQNNLNNEELVENRGRKRTRREESWGRSIRKKKRNSGEEYVGRTAKKVSERKQGSPCACEQKCYELLTEEERKALFKQFWELCDFSLQNAYISGCVKVSEVKKRYGASGDESRRQHSREYYISIEGRDKRVCKQAFLSLHGISNGRLSRAVEKKQTEGTPKSDGRGKHGNRPNKTSEKQSNLVVNHIDSFPLRECHYSRRSAPNRKYLPEGLNITMMYKLYVDWIKQAHCSSDIVSEYVYREIFNTKFNLAFSTPSTDTCKVCDALQIKISAIEDEVEKAKLKQELDLHQLKAQRAYNNLQSDVAYSKANTSVKVIAFDLQQALPTPHLHTSEVFYKRQLWTYNFCVHDCTSDSANMYVWPENVAGRGADEVISCLMKYALNALQNCEKLIVYSDNCFAQNKNVSLVSFWLQLIHKQFVKEIEHKYLVSGHSYLPCDRDFGLIEKKKRMQKYVYTPADWAELIRNTKAVKKRFNVTEMQQADFVSAKPLTDKITNRKYTEDKKPVAFSRITIFKFSITQPWKYNVKFSYSDLEEGDYVNVVKGQKRKDKHTLDLRNINLQPKYVKPRPINPKKLKDIKDLLKYVPPVYHTFYNSLVSENVTENCENERDGEFFDMPDYVQ